MAPKKGQIAEVGLPSGRVCYLQYLQAGPLGDFVRVLEGIFLTSQLQSEIDRLAGLPDAFVSQCRWSRLVQRPDSRLCGLAQVPGGDHATIIREAPTSAIVEDDVFLTPDGHYRRDVT